MIYTAEAVSPMHPDKICDRISDAILDECLRQDPFARVAVETMGGHGIITVTGEMTTSAFVDIPAVVRGIVGSKYGVQVNIARQSPEIGRGVDEGGAGDQGVMVGYACNENEAMIPQELYLARNLCQFLYEKNPQDGKTQITLEDGKIKTLVASWANTSHRDLLEKVFNWKFYPKEESDKPRTFVNPAGDWETSGFDADTGLTGRKIVADAYGPRVPVGGGAFSGKDATKVDRSGAYVARKLAVNYLKGLKAKEVFVTLAYVIGQKEPVQVRIIADGKEKEDDGYDLTPQRIIEFLDLGKPQFEKTAEWGAFGHGFAWDK